MMTRFTRTLLMMFLLAAQFAWSQDISAGKRLYERISGQKAKRSDLTQIKTLAQAGDYVGIARMAMDTASHGALVMRKWADYVCNGTEHNPVLNDCSALVTYCAVTGKDMRECLFGNLAVTVNPAVVPGVQAYSALNNDHFSSVPAPRTLDFRTAFTETTQTALNPQFTPDMVMGITTTRTLGKEFFEAGSNRRLFERLFERVLGLEQKTLKNPNLPPTYIGPDVDGLHNDNISPNHVAEATDFQCLGCHASMDGARPAVGLYDFIEVQGGERLVIAPNMEKLERNAENNNGFLIDPTQNPAGFLPTTTTWYNLFIDDARLGFRANKDVSGSISQAELETGTTPASYARALSSTRALVDNLSREILKIVCNDGVGPEFAVEVSEISKCLEDNAYDMREGIACAAAKQCAKF